MSNEIDRGVMRSGTFQVHFRVCDPFGGVHSINAYDWIQFVDL